MRTLGLGIVMVVAGFWLRSHYEPVVRVCNTGLGGFARALSTGADRNCSTAQDAVSAAPWLIGVGAALAIGAVLALAGVLAALGLSSRRGKKDTGS